jgi:hypothetical protein
MQQLLRTQPESSAARATERGASTGKAKRDLDLSLNLPRLRGSRSHEHRRRTTTSHAATVRDQSANRTQWFCAPAQHVINDATKLAASHTTDSTRGCNLDGTTLLTNVQFVVDLCAVAVTLQSRRVRRSGGGSLRCASFCAARTVYVETILSTRLRKCWLYATRKARVLSHSRLFFAIPRSPWFGGIEDRLQLAFSSRRRPSVQFAIGGSAASLPIPEGTSRCVAICVPTLARRLIDRTRLPPSAHREEARITPLQSGGNGGVPEHWLQAASRLS